MGEEGRSLRRNSFALTAIALLNMGAGFSWDIAIADKFGISARSDAFYLAYTLPGMITSVTYLSCNSIMVPTVARELATGLSESAWRLFSILLNFILLISLAVGLVGAVASYWVVRGLGPGLSAHSTDLATGLSMILFLSLPLAVAFEVLRTGLYACRRYVVPTGLDLLGNILITLAIIGAGGRLGITSAALGIAVAKAIQLAIIAPMLWAQPGFQYYRSLDLNFPGVREALRAFIAPISGIGTRRAIILVERVLASMLPPGSITALNYGSKLAFSVATAFYSSVTTALLPPLAAHLKRGDALRVLENLVASIKLVTFVSVPAVVLIVVLRQPLVATLFQRGQVNQEGLALTASVMAIYALSLFLMGHWRILQNFFYADATPQIVTGLLLLTAATNLTFDLILVRIWQAQGIAAATMINMSAANLVGFALLQRRLGGFPWARVAPFLARTGAATLVLLGALTLAQRAGIVSWDSSSDSWVNLYNLTVAAAIGGFAYLAASAVGEPSLLAAGRLRAPPLTRSLRRAFLNGTPSTKRPASVDGGEGQPSPSIDELPAWARRQMVVLGGIARRLDTAGAQFWLWGGWAVDFRAGRITRRHGDIDLVIRYSDRELVRRLLAEGGFRLFAEKDHWFQMRDHWGLTRRPKLPAWIRRCRALAPAPLHRLYGNWFHDVGTSTKVGCLLVVQDPSGMRVAGRSPEGQASWPEDALPEEPVTFHGVTCRVVSASALKAFKLQPQLLSGNLKRIKRSGGAKDRADVKVLDGILLGSGGARGTNERSI